VSEEPASAAASACNDGCASLQRLGRANDRLRRRVQRLEARVRTVEAARIAVLEQQVAQLERELRAGEQYRRAVRHLAALSQLVILLREAVLASGAPQGVRHQHDRLQRLDHGRLDDVLCRWCAHPDHAAK